MEFVIAVLAAYYLTTVFTNSDGPMGVFYLLRQIKAVKDFGMLECFICTSVWIAGVIILIPAFGILWTILAVAGASTLLWRFAE